MTKKYYIADNLIKLPSLFKTFFLRWQTWNKLVSLGVTDQVERLAVIFILLKKEICKFKWSSCQNTDWYTLRIVERPRWAECFFYRLEWSSRTNEYNTGDLKVKNWTELKPSMLLFHDIMPSILAFSLLACFKVAAYSSSRDNVTFCCVRECSIRATSVEVTVQYLEHGVHLNFFWKKFFDVVIRSNMAAI